VSWRAKERRWYAYGRVDGRMHALGLYETEEEAARVAAEWRREHMPFAVV
jgi:hypothetical protein